MPIGVLVVECDSCGEAILNARLEAVPGTTLCVPCQSEDDVERYKGIRPATNEAGQVAGCDGDIIRNQKKLKGLSFPTRRVCK